MTQPAIEELIGKHRQISQINLNELTDHEASILKHQLWSIELAIKKIGSKQYGICQDCKLQIDKYRMEALPHAARCINCQKKKESTR